MYLKHNASMFSESSREVDEQGSYTIAVCKDCEKD